MKMRLGQRSWLRGWDGLPNNRLLGGVFHVRGWCLIIAGFWGKERLMRTVVIVRGCGVSAMVLLR